MTDQASASTSPIGDQELTFEINSDPRGRIFVDPQEWVDMDAWHQTAASVRAEDPVFRVDMVEFPTFWAVTKHADVFEISRQNELFLNTTSAVLAPSNATEQMAAMGMPEPRSLIHLDGTTHRDHRQITNDWFKPAAVADRQERIDAIADEYVALMREFGDSCDFASDIAMPYTLRVIMDIYGVPQDDEPLMLELTQGLFGANDPEYQDGRPAGEVLLESVMRFIQYFAEITQDRQANPRDDLASVIANGQIDGCPMGDIERVWYYMIVATAGHDTTSFALSGGMQKFAESPDQLRLLRDQPDLVVNAAEEMIRWTTPVRHFMRYPQDDVEVRGVPIAAGEPLLLSYPSANRDDAAFERPDEFDISRLDADKQISFGLGSHFCLGAQFARRELRTMMSKLSQQLESIELDGPAEFQASSFVSGVKHLPVGYTFR